MTSVSLFTAPATSEVQTMSTREIAALTGSTHDNVLKTVRALVERGVVFQNETLYTHPQNGQQYPEFLLNYRDSMVVVSGYSPELRAKIIDRWQELEQGKGSVSNATLPTQAAPQFEALFKLATLIGCDNNAAAISANQGTIAATGLDLLGIMCLKALPSPEQAIYYTPTELGKQCTPTMSAAKVNQALAGAGLQQNTAGHWEATEAGKPYSRTLDTGKKHNSGVPVQQVKWLAKVLEVAGVAV